MLLSNDWHTGGVRNGVQALFFTLVALNLALGSLVLLQTRSSNNWKIQRLPDRSIVRLAVQFKSDVPLFAEICKPKGRGPFPSLVLVHGGFVGPNESTQALCRAWAQAGYLVALPHLRGQGRSQGQIEICGKEGSDVRQLADGLPQVGGTAQRAYVGISLGACVALGAARNDPRAKGVAFLLGATDFEAMMERLERYGRTEAYNRWQELIGASPQACPACYRQRSPLTWAHEVTAPLLLIAAGNDPIVSPLQYCALAKVREASGRSVRRVALTREGQLWTAPLIKERACLGKFAGLGQFTQDHLVLYPDLEHTTTPAIWRLVNQALAHWLKP